MSVQSPIKPAHYKSRGSFSFRRYGPFGLNLQVQQSYSQPPSSQLGDSGSIVDNCTDSPIRFEVTHLSILN